MRTPLFILVATLLSVPALSQVTISGTTTVSGNAQIGSSGVQLFGLDYSASDPNNPYVPSNYGSLALPAVGQANAFTDTSFPNSNIWRLTGFAAVGGTGQDSGPAIDYKHRYVYITPLDSNLNEVGSQFVHITGAATTGDVACIMSFGSTYQGWWGMNNVVRSGGNAWNDQDLYYIVDGATSQLVRVNIPLCEADASKTASIGKSYVEVWDNLVGSDSNPYHSVNVCFHGGGLTSDGNHICLSDNWGDGVANDPRMYTIGGKNSGTFGSSWAGLGYYTITSLSCPTGTSSTCNLTVTGNPSYPQYTAVHSKTTNCGNVYWFIATVTDANNYTVTPFTGTHPSSCSDAGGFTVQNLRSAQIAAINTGWGIALRQRMGDVANGRPLYNELYDTGTGAFIKIVTTTHVHSAYYAQGGDYYLLKSTSSGGTPTPPVGCTNGFFSIKFSDLSTTCFTTANNTYPYGEVYMDGYPAIYNGFPYVMISTTDDYQTDSWPIGAGDKTWAVGSVTTSGFRETDATVTGQCSGPGGGSNIAYCGWDSGTVTHYPISTTSVPWRADYVTAWDVARNTGTHGTKLLNNTVWLANVSDPSQQPRQLLHHRSLAVEQTLASPRGPFDSLAHINGDADGCYIVFDSSWGNSGQIYPFIAQVKKLGCSTVP